MRGDYPSTKQNITIIKDRRNLNTAVFFPIHLNICHLSPHKNIPATIYKTSKDKLFEPTKRKLA